MSKSTHDMLSFIPALIAVVFASITFLTLDDYGITWDERYNFYAASEYAKWLKHPRINTIDNYWHVFREHPPLCKVASGISFSLFSRKLDLLVAYRIPSVIFVFLLTFALFSFTFKLYGKVVAFWVSTSFFFLPRVFFHSHLAAMDYPVTAMSFLTIYSYWKGIENRKWMILSSFLMGFSLLTKIYAFFTYIPVFFYWALFFGRDLLNLFKKKPLLHSWKEIVSGIVYMLLIPPVVFIAFWPWFWKNTLERFMWYITHYSSHIRIPVYYFGEKYLTAPWHYPFVLTAVTLPLVILMPFLIGIFVLSRKEEKKTKLLILMNAFLPMVVLSLPGVAKFDGVRLFLPAFPFICMLGGAGIFYILNMVKRFWWKTGVIYIYTFLLLAMILKSNLKYHPYQSSYFSEIIGGLKGAERIGMELEYWGHPYKEGVNWLNRNAEYGSEVGVLVGMELAGFGLRKDLELVWPDRTGWLLDNGKQKYVMYINRRGFLPEKTAYLEEWMQTVFTVERDGVVLLKILKRVKSGT